MYVLKIKLLSYSLENLYILFVRTLLFSCVLLKNFIVEFEELFYFFRGDDYGRTAGDLRKHVGGLPVLARKDYR